MLLVVAKALSSKVKPIMRIFDFSGDASDILKIRNKKVMLPAKSRFADNINLLYSRYFNE